jgi:hypothetical protein
LFDIRAILDRGDSLYLKLVQYPLREGAPAVYVQRGLQPE